MYFVTKCSLSKSIRLIAVVKCMSKYLVYVGVLPTLQHNLQTKVTAYLVFVSPIILGLSGTGVPAVNQGMWPGCSLFPTVFNIFIDDTFGTWKTMAYPGIQMINTLSAHSFLQTTKWFFKNLNMISTQQCVNLHKLIKITVLRAVLLKGKLCRSEWIFPSEQKLK